MYSQKDLELAKQEVERRKEQLQSLNLMVKDYQALTPGEYMMIAIIKHDMRRAVAQYETIKQALYNREADIKANTFQI